MSEINKRGLVTFLNREQRLWRNKLRAEDGDFNRGYHLGQAHAFATAIRYAQALRKKATRSGARGRPVVTRFMGSTASTD